MAARDTQSGSRRPVASREHSAPEPVLKGLWITLIALSLLSADDQRERVARDEWLGSQALAVALAEGTARVASAFGLSQFYAATQRLAAACVPDPPRSAAARLATSSDAARPAIELRPEDPSAAEVAATGADENARRAVTTQPLDFGQTQVRRVLLVGASSMQFYLGAELEALLTSNYDQIQVLRRAKVSTGLARPDRVDWLHEVALLVAEFHPDLVVSDFGGNDAQNMLLSDNQRLKFGTPEWDAEYRARLGRLIQIAQAGRARIALLGMPSARSPSFSRRMQALNVLIEQEAIQRGAVFVPTWDLSADANGRYREAGTVDGVRGLMRLADGKHYSRLGAVAVTRRLVQRLEQSFALLPKDRKLAVALRRDMQSAALGRSVPYIAYVPQAIARGQLRGPALLLLHGAEGSYADWPEHAHRVLQQLATENGLVIVTPDGAKDGWYLDSPILPRHRYATWLTSELIHDIDAWLPTNGRHGIAGLSAGGHGAITLALTHPGLFRSASSMSGVLDLTQATNRPALVRALGPYSNYSAAWHARSATQVVAQRVKSARRLSMLITVGSSDRWAPVNRKFSQQLQSLHVPHQFYETEGGHDWDYWVGELPRHVTWHAGRLAGASR